ncbi:hypothetical protein GOV06_00220 [Candidatus Woesearchaeota archaeon]|nr:hypothetical protein [Candidatus Woesearchaeota archaeon]
MQKFEQALKILEKSKEFKDWKKKNKEAYLSYGFLIVQDGGSDWKIGYYHKKRDGVTSFNVGDKITVEPEDDVFRKEKKEVLGIDIKEIKYKLADAINIAVELQKKEFSAESPKKIIVILQKLDIGQIWNITFLTQSFSTLNIKVRSDTGEVVEKKLQPLFGMDK